MPSSGEASIEPRNSINRDFRQEASQSAEEWAQLPAHPAASAAPIGFASTQLSRGSPLQPTGAAAPACQFDIDTG